MADYIEKYQLKMKGLDLEKEDPKKAIEFYKNLLNHEYFINDYYIYRRLVLMYKKTKEFDKKVNVIRCFFKSEIYCNKRNYLWFRNKLRFYSKKGFISTEEINELTDYFKNHALINKDKANTPLPIAERIKKHHNNIIVVSEEEYNKTQRTYELEEIAGELKRQGRYYEVIDLYNKMINSGYRSYRYYKSLCIAYRNVNDLDSELETINKYFEGNSTRTDAGDKWFEKRLEDVLKRIPPNDTIAENIKLKQEIEDLKKQINDLERRIDLNENQTSSNVVKTDLKSVSKKSNELGIDDETIYEFPIDDELEYDNSFYQFDSNLDEKTNIRRKIILKEYARQLGYDKKYDDAIDFYNKLKDNSYFDNDWYPYRQLTIIYDKTKNYKSNLENIKELFYSGIYLNKYQYIWFTNKIKLIMENINVDESEVQEWLDYYDVNGSKNKSQLNNYLADQFTKKDDMIKVLDRKSFDYRQEIYGLEQIGMINEKVGNFELAIAHYKNIIDEKKYNIFKFYQRICLCLEKLNDYSRELDAIRLYYSQPPQKVTDYSDEWFEKRLIKVNSKLGTRYNVNDLKEI